MSRTHHFISRAVQTFKALANTLSSQIRHTDVGTAHMSGINHSAWWSGWNPSPRILPPLARVANWTSRPNPQATGSPPSASTSHALRDDFEGKGEGKFYAVRYFQRGGEKRRFHTTRWILKREEAERTLQGASHPPGLSTMVDGHTKCECNPCWSTAGRGGHMSLRQAHGEANFSYVLWPPCILGWNFPKLCTQESELRHAVTNLESGLNERYSIISSTKWQVFWEWFVKWRV